MKAFAASGSVQFAFPLFVATLFAATLSIAPPAVAEDAKAERPRHYVGLEGGMGVANGFDPQLPGVSDTGFEVGAAVVVRGGTQWRDHIRFDGQLGWHGTGIDDIAGRLDIAAATANVYYDLGAPDAWVRPYVGVGFGVAGGWLQSDLPAATGALARQSGVGLAYVIAGGGRFRLTDTLMLACAWQFLGTGALIETSSGNTINPTMHAFMVGLHHAF